MSSKKNYMYEYFKKCSIFGISRFYNKLNLRNYL